LGPFRGCPRIWTCGSGAQIVLWDKTTHFSRLVVGNLIPSSVFFIQTDYVNFYHILRYVFLKKKYTFAPLFIKILLGIDGMIVMKIIQYSRYKSAR